MFAVKTLSLAAALLCGSLALLQEKEKKEEMSGCGALVKADAAKRLPAGTRILEPAEKAEFRGRVVCGRCVWKIGDACNVMLWDQEAKHVVMALPNQRLYELEKLYGT